MKAHRKRHLRSRLRGRKAVTKRSGIAKVRGERVCTTCGGGGYASDRTWPCPECGGVGRVAPVYVDGQPVVGW